MPHFYYYIYQILPQNLVIFGNVFILNHQVPSNQIHTKVKNPPIRPFENNEASGFYQQREVLTKFYFILPIQSYSRKRYCSYDTLSISQMPNSQYPTIQNYHLRQCMQNQQYRRNPVPR